MEAHINQAPCLYFSSTDDGVVVDVNDTLCRCLHFSREELIGQKLDNIFTVSTRIFQQTHFFPLLRMHGHAEEIFITLRSKTGDAVPVLISAVRNTTDEKGLLIFAGIVVHNRKKFEDELVAAKKAAEKALLENTALQQAKESLQKHTELLDLQMSLVRKQNEELRQFSHVVTHELQEPLRKLLMFTNMLLEEDGAIFGNKSAKKIANVSEQMRTIISGLQQYVWLTETPVTWNKLDLTTLINEVKEQLRNDHPDVKVDVVAAELPLLNGDREQLQFLFFEIFRNAIRFRKEDSHVEVRIRTSELQLNKFRNVSNKYQFTSFLKIEISDNGAGFDEVYRDQAFALFKRLHPKSGRGVGLSLCKKIVENHQGSIEISSRQGEGTTITVFLPNEIPTPAVSKNMNDQHQKQLSDNESQ